MHGPMQAAMCHEYANGLAARTWKDCGVPGGVSRYRPPALRGDAGAAWTSSWGPTPGPGTSVSCGADWEPAGVGGSSSACSVTMRGTCGAGSGASPKPAAATGHDKSNLAHPGLLKRRVHDAVPANQKPQQNCLATDLAPETWTERGHCAQRCGEADPTRGARASCTASAGDADGRQGAPCAPAWVRRHVRPFARHGMQTRRKRLYNL
jgi:hypothetical protein